MLHIHFIGIGGIGVSALARLFLSKNCSISGSDSTDSELLHDLRSEGMTIFIGHAPENIPTHTTRIIYSEALVRHENGETISKSDEWNEGKKRGIEMKSYPEAMAEIFNVSYGIAVAGTHGKSTTTAMLGAVMQEASTIVGTKVPQFDGKNVHIGNSGQFVLETCEYRKALLNYRPKIAIITNIDFDHPDSYRDLDDYRNVFQRFIVQVSDWIVLSADDEESKKLDVSGKNIAWVSMKERKWWIEQSSSEYGIVSIEGAQTPHSFPLPPLTLQVPGDHLLTDAYLAFVAAKIAGVKEEVIIERLESYQGCWRRSEFVKKTAHGNLLFSDYGHHPSEIRPTLKAFKEKYPERTLTVIFQPHQYARTIGLLSDFKTAFDDADTLIISNIYFSRDTAEDVAAMPAEKFVSELQSNYPQTLHGKSLENTAEIIRQLDRENPEKLLILLLGAGDIDDVRGMV